MNWRSISTFSLCIVAISGLIFSAIGPDLVSAARSYAWQTAPCVILSSKIVEEPYSPTVMHYVPKVDYTYTFAGREYRSARFTTSKRQGFVDFSRAERAVTRFAPGFRTTCFVNPRTPVEAVLQRGELWGGIFLLAPF